MASPIVTRAQRLAADELLSYSSRWARGVRHVDGQAFVTFTSKTAVGVVYFASTLGCTCPGFKNRGRCCHSIAVAEDAARQSRPAPIRSYDELYPKCASCDDLADTADGYCDRCASDREFQARRTARMAS